MCGIVGVFEPKGFSSSSEIEARVRRAADAVAYRGPDASGYFALPKEGIAFGHRRLSILDLEVRSNQPMSSADGDILLTYNGEIYNFRELRSALEGEGAVFRTKSDTEVLIEGYRAWGLSELLKRSVGMFAFALFDKKERLLYLARDRAGQKPLFYSRLSSGGIVFGSEMRSILILKPEARALDPAGLDAYLSLKMTPSPRTLFKGVQKLPPGHFLALGTDRCEAPESYWSPLAGSIGEKPWTDRIGEALDRSVRRRLISDVPVCLFLSGGVDSGLIAEAVGRYGVSGTKAYSVGYTDLPQYNEFSYARQTAKRLPLELCEVMLDSQETKELLRDDSLILDEPLSDWVWVPLYQLSRQAHSDGFKVVLLGEGADELFFGYDVMMKGLSLIEKFDHPIWRAAASVGARVLSPVYRRTHRGHRRYDLWRRVSAGEPVYMGSSVGFGRSQRHQVAGPRLLEEGDAATGSAAIASLHARFERTAQDSSDSVNRICFLEFYAKMTEILLQRVDRISMLHSLEARSPFLDHELIEAAFAVKGREKIRGGLKGLLKEYARTRIPRSVVDRKKMGFSFPFKEWLRADLGEHVTEIFSRSPIFDDGWLNQGFALTLLKEHRAGRFDHAPKIWTLYSLCRWYDKWLA